MKNYCYILTVCSSVLLLSSIIPAADGLWFFAMQSMWSSIVLYSVLLIERSNLSQRIACVELTAMLVNLSACLDYMTDGGLFFENYVDLMKIMIYIEIAILILGMPRDEIRRAAGRLWACAVHTCSNVNRCV